MTRRTFRINLPGFLKAPFQLSLLISSASTLFLLISFFRLQPIVPLSYSLADANDYLVDKRWLILLPVFSFVITFGHVLLIKLLYKHEKIIPILFVWCTIVIQVLFLLELLRIVFIIS